ncbi:hypothetical protein [Flavobacterium sp. JP2137]|uniref:hypothetical protein n=1 Tax=Flavobacterium sp. JP2137 TaxID=3414510 RepID=UPI003D2FAB4A
MTTVTPRRSSWMKKFIESLLAAICLTNFALGFVTLLPQKVMQYFPVLMISSLIASVFFAVFFAIYWHRAASTQTFDSPKTHAYLQGILRYCLAFFLSIYGFAKLFNAQFVSAYHLDDSLVSSLTGSELTWNYFAYSYELSFIIGLCQLIGGALLLFRRTTLAGIALLLPILLNVVLINKFYHISAGAFINSVVYTAVLIYLLTLYSKELLALFWNYRAALPKVGKRAVRNAARLLSIGLAFGFVWFVVHKDKPVKYLGKWKVETLERNGKSVPENQWLQDSTAWKTVYFEKRNQLYLCPNPYVFEAERSLYLQYQYDAEQGDLQLISYERNPNAPDTIAIKVSRFTEQEMQWNWMLYGDTIQLQLKRLK